ncbi:beta family protein [Pseudorhodoplanes sp.]|uniref:beta family protein n=1 Tax=Pseudorhodoplanes sp. TaxID=1934341 RepID=UPI003D110624
MSLLSEKLSSKYVPILAIRPAEMRALEELPEHDKDQMLPIALLRPWLRSARIDNTTRRWSEAYGSRPWIADIDPYYPSLKADDDGGDDRPVFTTLDSFSIATDGYKAWCDFVTGLNNVIPCVRIGPPAEATNIRLQIRRLKALSRGICVRVPRQPFPQLTSLLQFLAMEAVTDVMIVLDFLQVTGNDLPAAAQAVGYINTVRAQLPTAAVVLSATTFPESFDGISRQEIAERAFFDSVRRAIPGVPLIFSDRGSAREERREGGFGRPLPRIDYPTPNDWYFFRERDGYQIAAERVMSSRQWDPRIMIWGTQQIQQTAKADPYAIISPARSTAVRINLHLHRQLFYGDPDGAIKSVEDDWVD